MDEAYVSRSSIRRYYHRMGYDNLSDLKSSVSDIIFPSNIHLRSFNEVERYKPELMNSLVQMIVELNDAITKNIIEEFCQSLANYEEVYVYTANNT